MPRYIVTVTVDLKEELDYGEEGIDATSDEAFLNAVIGDALARFGPGPGIPESLASVQDFFIDCCKTEKQPPKEGEWR